MSCERFPIEPVIEFFHRFADGFRYLLCDNWTFRRAIHLIDIILCRLTCEGDFYSTTANVTDSYSTSRVADSRAKLTSVRVTGTNQVYLREGGVLIGVLQPSEKRVLPINGRLPITAKCDTGLTSSLNIATTRFCNCGDAVQAEDSDFKQFDFAVLRFTWGAENGTDLDTRTAITNSGESSVDGVDVGWNRPIAGQAPRSIDFGGKSLLSWGGDNTGEGVEAVLIDVPGIKQVFPSLQTIDIRIRAFWYEVRHDGRFTLTFNTYLGGVMNAAGFDFLNDGGSPVNSLSIESTVSLVLHTDANGDPVCILRINLVNNTANIIV